MLTKNEKYRIRILAGAIVIAGFAFCYFYLPSAPVAATNLPLPEPTPRRIKYSEFPHSQKAHRLECNTCHKFPSDNWNKVRPEDTAFPDITDYPKHQSCLKCHKQQFFKGSPPKICSICHLNPSAKDSSRHPFPNPREIYDQSKKGKTAESDFVVGFPHEVHLEIVSANQHTTTPFVNASYSRSERRLAGEESCAVCHKTMKPQGDSEDEYLTPPPADLGDAFWVKKGMFKSAPIGHTVCFTCHTAEMGMLPAQQDCGKCHHLKPPQPPSDYDPKLAASMGIDDKVMMDAWQIRHSAGKFRHEFIAHVDLECATCHNVTTMNTADPSTMKVTISSCAMCHVTATSADGGSLNMEMDERKKDPVFQCVKCHITFGKQPVPESHVKVITEAAGQ